MAGMIAPSAGLCVRPVCVFLSLALPCVKDTEVRSLRASARRLRPLSELAGLPGPDLSAAGQGEL